MFHMWNFFSSGVKLVTKLDTCIPSICDLPPVVTDKLPPVSQRKSSRTRFSHAQLELSESAQPRQLGEGRLPWRLRASRFQNLNFRLRQFAVVTRADTRSARTARDLHSYARSSPLRGGGGRCAQICEAASARVLTENGVSMRPTLRACIVTLWLPSTAANSHDQRRTSAVAFAAAAAANDAPTCPCANKEHCSPIRGHKPARKREIFGFGGGNGSTVDFTRVTTVAWADNSKLMCAAHAAGARVVIAAPQPEAAFSANATIRSQWVNAAVRAVVNSFTDGLVFDWESPCAADCPEQRHYVQLMNETRAALRRLAPSYQVTVCVAWSPDGIDGRDYDIRAFAASADLLYVMDYDTRSQVFDACIAAANAPLYGALHGIERYLARGIPPSMLILGVPWYGYRYPCVAGTAADARFCPLTPRPFRGAPCSDAAGTEVGYATIVARLPGATTARRWDATQGAPFFNTLEGGDVVQYWYDDVQSLSPKYAHARSLGLRGVGPYVFTDVQHANDSMFAAFDAFLLPDSGSTRQLSS